MAINPLARFAFQVLLTKDANDTRTEGAALMGTAYPDTAFRDGSAPFFGRHPHITLQGSEVRIEVQPTDRPRWWMLPSRKWSLAHCRRARLSLIEGFVERIVREGDVFGLARGMNGTISLSLYRHHRCILACGDLRDLTSDFSASEGPDFVPLQRDGLVGRIYRRGQLTRGYVGPPYWGPYDLPPFSGGRGPYLMRFAARLNEGISAEDVVSCALALARPNLEAEPW